MSKYDPFLYLCYSAFSDPYTRRVVLNTAANFSLRSFVRHIRRRRYNWQACQDGGRVVVFKV